MSGTAETSPTRAWLIAARPHTLPAAASPVMVGTGLALHDGVFAPLPAAAALIAASLIQIGTNFANDYFDAQSGADEDAEGFTRVTQSGLLRPRTVWRATLATFAASILLGGYLVAVGGVPILVIGLASVASGFLYTGGPYPLGYHGLGDVFVFVFFGLVAVTGTYYVQAVSGIEGFLVTVQPAAITEDAILASLTMAGLITAILVVNNIRDIESDRAAGKRTLAVRIGYRLSRLEFVALVSLAYVVPLLLHARGFAAPVLLPLLTIPVALRTIAVVLTERSGPALNDALTQTGQLTAMFAVLFAAGLAT